jgi:hypothetical protein
MLAKRPEDRFQTPAELSAALAGCTDQLGLAPAQVALRAYWSTWAPRPARLRRHAAWLMPTVVLLVSVFGLALWWNHEATLPEFSDLQIRPTSTATDNSTNNANKPPAPVERNGHNGQ